MLPTFEVLNAGGDVHQIALDQQFTYLHKVLPFSLMLQHIMDAFDHGLQREVAA